MPSQITIPIQIPPPSTSSLHYVRIHTKLLRLLELYRPSYALHSNLDGRKCKEEMRQGTSRAFHCGLGYLQHMSIASTLVLSSTNQDLRSILGALARLLRPQGSQLLPVSGDDAGNVQAQIPGDFIISHAHKRHAVHEPRLWASRVLRRDVRARHLATTLMRRATKIGEHG